MSKMTDLLFKCLLSCTNRNCMAGTTVWDGNRLFGGQTPVVTVKRESRCLVSRKLHTSVALAVIRDTRLCIFTCCFYQRTFLFQKINFEIIQECSVVSGLDFRWCPGWYAEHSSHSSRNVLQQFRLSPIPKLYQTLMISWAFQRSMLGRMIIPSGVSCLKLKPVARLKK